jgi:hypothetical protein
MNVYVNNCSLLCWNRTDVITGFHWDSNILRSTSSIIDVEERRSDLILAYMPADQFIMLSVIFIVKPESG